MQILKADLEHLDQLVALDEDSRENPWSKQIWQSELENNQSLNFLLIEKASICGGIFGRMNPIEAELFLVLTHPSERRKGVADQLMKHWLKEATRDQQEIFLEVADTNLAARALYDKFGFVEVGVRKNYYSDGSDAILMKM